MTARVKIERTGKPLTTDGFEAQPDPDLDFKEQLNNNDFQKLLKGRASQSTVAVPKPEGDELKVPAGLPVLERFDPTEIKPNATVVAFG